MNLVILQYTARCGWVLTYNGTCIKSFNVEHSRDGSAGLRQARNWLAHNPEGWHGDVQVQIIGTLDSVIGHE